MNFVVEVNHSRLNPSKLTVFVLATLNDEPGVPIEQALSLSYTIQKGIADGLHDDIESYRAWAEKLQTREISLWAESCSEDYDFGSDSLEVDGAGPNLLLV